jgi:hypothetical protein
MPRAREVARQRARSARAVRAKIAQEEEIARRGQLSRVLLTAHEIITDSGFIALAKLHRADWAPKRLVHAHGTSEAADAVLGFVVAWKYFFPVIQNKDMRSYLDEKFPGFVEELKDTFIGLVMKGPFIGERKPALGRLSTD